jgi:hypothetical protein
VDKILEQARKLQVMPLLAGVFVCYCGVFAATLVTAITGIASPATDFVSHPEQASIPQHAVFGPLLGALLALVIMAAAGYGCGMLALVREVQHGAAVGIIFVVSYVPYLFDLTRVHGIDTWADWVIIVLTIPATMWGAGRFAASSPKAGGS